MKLLKQKEENRFALANLNFTDIKTIKDACKFYGSQGSKAALELAAALETEMDQVEI